MTNRYVLLLTLLAVGCGPATNDADPPTAIQEAERPDVPGYVHPTGSSTLVGDAQGYLYTVNVDEDTVSRIDTRSTEVLQVNVGDEPSRIAIAQQSLYVSLRGEGAVAQLDRTDLARGVVKRVELGAEPLGVVASEDGTRVYVALALEGQVVELDGDLTELRRFTLPGEPRYLALHPAGTTLFVGSSRTPDALVAIDLVGGTREVVDLPPTERHPAPTEQLTDTGLPSEPEPFEPIPLESRITGDLWITPDGLRLLVPTLYLDTTTPIMPLGSIAEIPNDPPEPEIPAEPNPGGYGGMSFGSDAPIEVVDRVTPAIVEVPTDRSSPVGSRALLAVAPIVSQLPGIAGSYISSVSSSPDGTKLIATMDASRAAILMERRQLSDTVTVSNRARHIDSHPAADLEAMGFSVVPTQVVMAGLGPNGGVFQGPSELYVHNAFDGTVTQVATDAALATLANGGADPTPVPTAAGWPASTPTTSSYVRDGRRLFFGAREFETGATGVSCSTCHFEGRSDGIVWTFDDGPRKTPSLAGVVSETTPLTWRSDVPTVADEAAITIQGRFFAEQPSFAVVDSIAAYVDWSRQPHRPTLDAAAVERGRTLYDAAGCGSCHNGERYTDRQSHEIRGVLLDTPSLTGIAGRAPYLHDGSAQTLRELLERSADGSMGFTGNLSDAQLDDLEAFLKSL